MKTIVWPCPAPGGSDEEFALVAGPDRAPRLLIVPALFEEANKTRRLLAQTMRALAARGVASVLPDLPGCNESLALLEAQGLASWRAAAAAAAEHFAADHVLALRGGALLAPPLPGWRLEAIGGPSVLRQLVRARLVASKESGRAETGEALLEEGRRTGLDLVGYRLGARLVRDLESTAALSANGQLDLALDAIGGSALWLRSEPGEDADMAERLAALLAEGMAR